MERKTKYKESVKEVTKLMPKNQEKEITPTKYKERIPLQKSKDTERKNLSIIQGKERKNQLGIYDVIYENIDDVTNKQPNIRNVTSQQSVAGVTKPGTVDTTHQMRNVTSQRVVGNTKPGKAIEKNLDHGQAYENTFDHGQTNKRKATVTTMIQPREKGTGMITKAKEFLEKASKEKDKEAEKKLEKENRCAMCKKLHNCSK